MKGITTVGLDLAKSVFQVHAIDADGAVVARRQVKRAQLLLFFSRLQPCLIGMEACAGRTTGHGNWQSSVMMSD